MDENTLKQLVAKEAKEKLREDESTKQQYLDQFREWILKNPDIQECRTDDRFLLRFLRTKKYSLPMAQELMLNFLSFRQSFMDIMTHVDIEDPEVNAVITSGYCFCSPFRDENGRMVLINIPRNFDMNKFDWTVTIKVFMLNFHWLMEDDATQVLGIAAVSDVGDHSPACYSFIPPNILTSLVKQSHNSVPLRIFDVKVANLSALGKKFMDLILSLLSQKLRNRLKICKNYEELHNNINPNLLPKEIGGTMPLSEMTDLWKKKLAVHRDSILQINKTRVLGESYRAKESFDENIGVSGSFRKLEID